MKKLLLGLACAASLGLWMSCANDELDVTVHEDIDTVTYNYAGTVTATRYVYQPVEIGTAKPASGKYYYIDTFYDSSKGEVVTVNKYFRNAWVADKTPVTDNVARIRWTLDTSGKTQTNMTTYTFQFRDDTSVPTTINKSGDTYSTNEGIVIDLTAGTLDGTTFTIKELPYSKTKNGTLPDEDDNSYYNQYKYYSDRYVYYGSITYTRNK